MSRNIKRRDFLNGVLKGTAITAGMLATAPNILAAEVAKVSTGNAAPVYYPPVLTGMRGSHEGSYEVAHALAWRGDKPSQYQTLDEHYDVVIVGAGMSGLGAAWYWRKKMGDDAKILLLDNHDDFGGHAKRNEFHHNGRMLLNLGGAQNLENPDKYSENARTLLEDIGIDEVFLEKLAANTPEDYVLGGNFDADMGLALPATGTSSENASSLETISGDWNSWFFGGEGYAEAINKLPIDSDQKEKLTAFIGGDRDFLNDKSLREKYQYCSSVSYSAFLAKDVGLSPSTIAILDNRLRVFMGVTGGSLSVREAIYMGSPGLKAMGWLAGIANSLMTSVAEDTFAVRMFPDGNASIARLLVQKLIPAVAPDMQGVEDVAAARFDYSALDLPGNTRLRLSSTAVGVEETESGRVHVDYVKDGKALRVSGDHCILACYNGIVPHLCPKMPEAQKEALKYGVKVPFVYASVLVENGEAFSKLGASLIQCPGQDFQWVSAAPTMAISGYEPPRDTQDPMVIFLMGAPVDEPQANESVKDLLRFARHKVYASTFDSFERSIRRQLQALLGTHGFDHESDIAAITVNRISHGYAYEYLELYDPEFPEGESPCEIGRAQFGRISVANSDSEARAYMDAAWDAAWRAVNEQTG